MAKLIVVCGATGQLGGSTARRMLKEGWSVRGITRNKTSSAAKALAEAGAELAVASYDDADSLQAAFKGANAVFAVTNSFDYLMELGQDAAAEKEYQQMMNVAKAASKTESLEHLVLHTLPAGVKLGGPKTYVPHMDTKDRAADDIKKDLPELAKKTTFLWIGLFVSNFYAYPMMKPAELPNSYGAHVYIQPIDPNVNMYIAGDIEHNIGSFVNAILAKPEISLPAKYAFAYSDSIPFVDMLVAWSEVTGRRATFVQCTLGQYEELWGIFGKELGAQWAALEAQPDWAAPYRPEVITAKELGIPSDDIIDLKAALLKDKDKL